MLGGDKITNFGAANRAATERATPDLYSAPPSASLQNSSRSDALFILPKKGWTSELARRVHRLFVRAELRIEQGQKLRTVFKHAAWFYSKPRYYRCDRTRRVKITRTALIRWLYRWRHGGRTPEAAALRYRGAPKLPRGQVTQLARLCLAPNVQSLSSAYRKLPNPDGTHHAFRYAMRPQLRKALCDVFAARRRVERLERRALKLLAKTFGEGGTGK
jgi:hypothetical protein